MTDHPRNPQPNAIIIVPIAGTLSNKTTPADFRRFAAIAHRRGICTEHPVPGTERSRSEWYPNGFGREQSRNRLR